MPNKCSTRTACSQWRRQEGAMRGSVPPPMSCKTTPVKRWNPRRNWGEILKSKIFSAKSHPQNAGNRNCDTLDFKIFRGSMPPDPTRMTRAFGARTLLTRNYDPWLRHCLQLYKYFFGEKHSDQYKQIRILLQEFNLETKKRPIQGNIDLLKAGLGVLGVQSFWKKENRLRKLC